MNQEETHTSRLEDKIWPTNKEGYPDVNKWLEPDEAMVHIGVGIHRMLERIAEAIEYAE